MTELDMLLAKFSCGFVENQSGQYIFLKPVKNYFFTRKGSLFIFLWGEKMKGEPFSGETVSAHTWRG